MIGLLCLSAKVDAAALISVDASPLSIPADGSSYSQILVTVLDTTGTSAPDGTEVRLTTSAGDITPVVYTVGGRAVGILTSSTFPQVAVVQATVEGVSGTAQVEFAASDYLQPSGSARTIRMEGGSLAYSADQDTVLGSNGVVIEYRGLTIEAVSAQVSQPYGEIRAQGDVTVRRGDQTATADALVCSLREDRVRMIDYEDETNVRVYDVGKLRKLEPGNTQAFVDFTPLVDVGGRTWIVCSRLVLIPNQRILFFKASIYVGDSKVISMPYYSYSYEKRESILQQVRYSSRDGMLVDLPFYYRMTTSGTGALKLRYAADGTETGSYYRPRKGMSFGLEQDYAIGDRSQGRLFVDSIASSSLAFELAHHLEYGSVFAGGRADFSARYQPKSSYSRDSYNASLSVMGNLRKYDYSIYGYLGGSRNEQYAYIDPETMELKYIDDSYGSIKAIIRPRARIMSGGFTLTPSLTVGYGNLWDSYGGPGTESLYESLGLSAVRSKHLSRNMALIFDGSAGLTSTAQGEMGASLRLRPSLRYHWPGGSTSLSYTLSLQDGMNDNSPTLSKHQLGCNLFVNADGKVSLFSSVNYGLDSQRLTLYSSLNYRFDRYWRFRSSYNLYRYAYEFNDYSYSYRNSYLKVGVYRPLGAYEIGLAWSPDGQNYGIDKDRRLWLEFGSSGF